MDSIGLAQISQSLRADRSEAFRVRDESEALDMFFHYWWHKIRTISLWVSETQAACDTNNGSAYRVIQIMFKVKCGHR